LFFDGEGVEKVAAEDERVLGRVDGVDPAGGNEESRSDLQRHHAALFNLKIDRR